LLAGVLVNEIKACSDISPYCGKYATKPKCRNNSYVRKRCQKSCGLCGGPPPTERPRPPVNTDEPPPPPSSGECGSRPNTRIVGGGEASPGSWPWQAMLRTPSGFGFCGGTLVDPQWVLTASHCVSGKGPRSLKVRLGAHSKRGNDRTAQDFSVQRVIMHESYKRPYGLSNDIALLKLSKPAQINNYVGLACLPGDSTPSLPIDNMSKKCWITGWGTLSSGGSSPRVLMQASVPLVSKTRCLRGYPRQIHDSMLCAGYDQGGVDSCQGDSGGPLVCEFGGKWYLEGATSWGHGCAARGKYGVYANIRYLRSWVRGKIGR